MARAVVGRAGELEAIERFLDAAGEGSAVLVIEGEPGIGKTTLVRAAIEAAQGRAARVLSCVASPSETRLSYAALADLLAGLDGRAIERLPKPQRRALDAALLRADPGGLEIDRRAVSAAVLSILEGLVEGQPVVVAIDDLQWLDIPTARVVEFCARRLPAGVGLVASRRVGAEAASADPPITLREPDHLVVHELGPLGADELGHLLRERAPDPLERRTLVRLQEASGGNPFYALELARALPADGPPPAALPLPASLDEIVSVRLASLGPDVEEALLAVAALADPTLDLLERALGPDRDRLLDEAEDRGLIELEDRRVRFTHPLLANGVYAHASFGRRRDMHRRLSGIVSDIEERARHLAYAGEGPDAVTALEQAARHVNRRGAPDVAAELLELALDLGGGPELGVRAAEHHFDAGASKRARALLEESLELLPSGTARAEALLLLSEVRYHDDSFPQGRALLEQARAEAVGNERLLVMIDLRLVFVLFNLGLLPAAVGSARAALERASRVDDGGLLAQALAASVMVDFNLGSGLDEERLAQALALEDPEVRAGFEFSPLLIASFLYLWTGQLDEGRAALTTVRELYVNRGAEHARAWTSSVRAWLECWAGDLASATAAADEGDERLLQLETTIGRALAATFRALLDAYAGRADEARRGAEEGLALFDRAGWTGSVQWPLMALGFLELSVGDHEAAAASVGPFATSVVAAGISEPAAGGGGLLFGDAAEALVGTGRIDEAEAIVSWLEDRGEALDRTWAIAVGARCRGLILAAAGEVEAAEEALARALISHQQLPMPIERARSLLVLGRIRRRLRKRRAAKEALDESLEIFESVGSPLWAEQARAEIACIGLRPRAEDELTPSELRVATLAAAGHTNREVAATLSVSPKTVEAHLARAYRKLGIHSRAELGARMARPNGSPEREPQGAVPTAET